MPLTNLTNKEKIISLLYMAKTVSSDIEVQNKQYQIIQIFLDNFIKECDYYPFVNIIRRRQPNGKGLEIIYTLNWQIKDLSKEEALKECDRLIEEFEYRNKKYIDITKVLIDELVKTRRPTREQLIYVQDFTRLHEDWMIKDPEEYIDMYHDNFYLERLIEYWNRY